MISLIKYVEDFWLKIIIIAFPLIFLTIGLTNWYNANVKIELYNDEVIANVSRIIESHDDDGTSYKPCFTYEYKGKLYEDMKNEMSSSSYEDMNVGDTVTLLVNPNNPEMFLFDAPTYVSFGRIFTFAGLGIYAFYALIDIIDIISRRKRNITKQNTCS